MRPVRWVRDAQYTMFNLHKNTLESAAPIRPVRANGLMYVCQTPEVFNHTFPIGKTSSIAFSGLISNLCVASTSLWRVRRTSFPRVITLRYQDAASTR